MTASMIDWTINVFQSPPVSLAVTQVVYCCDLRDFSGNHSIG